MQSLIGCSYMYFFPTCFVIAKSNDIGAHSNCLGNLEVG